MALLNWLACWLARMPGADWFAHWFARKYAGKWSPSHKRFSLPKEADVVMKATHGATKDRLALGSSAIALTIRNIKHDGPIFFSTYSGNPEGAREVEWTKDILPSAVHVGAIPTTSAEAIALKKHCDSINFYPRTMLIVTDEFNSRRTKDIYQLFFPETEIWIVAIPISKTHDLESPIVNFRDMSRAIWWETIIPMVPFWAMTHTGEHGKKLLIWLSNRIRQTAASPTAA